MVAGGSTASDDVPDWCYAVPAGRNLVLPLEGEEVEFEQVEVTGSTNSDLLARARERAPARTLVRVARRQHAGRGRMGRVWHGSDSGSLLFSLALRWRTPPSGTPAVTLACGLGIAELLRKNAVPVTVKWPNDLLLEGRKLAGILAESAEDAQGARTLVVGLGLNLAIEPEVREQIGHPVADLAEVLGHDAALEQHGHWLALLARATLAAARDFESRGFGPLHQRFNELLAYRDQPVALQVAGLPVQHGVARGVDAQGRLLFESDGQLREILSGEVSLRETAKAKRGPGGTQ